MPQLRPIEQTGALAFDYALNRRDRVRAEMVQRSKPVVVLSRWKVVGPGYKGTGKALEFAYHHLDGILDLLRELQRAFKLQQPNLDQPENAGTANDSGYCNVLRTNEEFGDNRGCDCEAACRAGGLFPIEIEIARRLSQDPATWASKALILERDGFPRIDPLMEGRYWPACIAWWNRRYGLATVEVSQPDGGENLDALK